MVFCIYPIEALGCRTFYTLVFGFLSLIPLAHGWQFKILFNFSLYSWTHGYESDGGKPVKSRLKDPNSWELLQLCSWAAHPSFLGHPDVHAGWWQVGEFKANWVNGTQLLV